MMSWFAAEETAVEESDEHKLVATEEG